MVNKMKIKGRKFSFNHIERFIVIFGIFDKLNSAKEGLSKHIF